MMTSILGSLIRHFLSGIGGVAIEQGLATGDQTTQIIGGLTALGAVIASMWAKWKAKQK